MMLTGFPIFANLWREHLEKLEEIAEELFLKKGTLLFSPGDTSKGFYVVLEGAVRVYGMSAQGKEITQEIAGRGNAFAIASPFSDTYHCFAETMKDSRLYLIKRKEFLALVTGDAEFATQWIRMLSVMLIQVRGRLADLSLKAPKARIANYVLLLSEMQDSQDIMLPVARKEVAALLGMTHETFYRTTKELVKEGLLQFAGQHIEILNRARLEEMAE